MRIWAPAALLAAILPLALLPSACNQGESTDRPRDDSENVRTVIFGPDGFEPLRLEVDAGDEVRFLNESEAAMWPASNIHPTHQIYPEFDAGEPIEPGESWGFTFDRPGFWRYHNHLGPERSGLVVVQGESAEGPPLALGIDGLEFRAAPEQLSLSQYVNLYDSDEAMTRFLREYGPAQAVLALEEGAEHTNADCHQRAHDAGRAAYDLFGAAAFYLSSHECQAGMYHGATEALFRDRGTANLREDVSVLCSYASVQFYYLQCLHGVGHGLMAWTSYELTDALALCEDLETSRDHQACYSGVFMENVIGGLSGLMGHVTEYLSDDPHYPCNAIQEEYVQMCYFYQSTRMMILYENDFARVAAACAAAPLEAHHHCFRSMGRDVGGFSVGDPARALQLCGAAEGSMNRGYCIEGAVQNRFWDTSGADDALTMCAMATDQGDRFACYRTIVFRAQELYETNDAYYAFCERVQDESFRAWCLSREVKQILAQ